MGSAHTHTITFLETLILLILVLIMIDFLSDLGTFWIDFGCHPVFVVGFRIYSTTPKSCVPYPSHD